MHLTTSKLATVLHDYRHARTTRGRHVIIVGERANKRYFVGPNCFVTDLSDATHFAARPVALALQVPGVPSELA